MSLYDNMIRTYHNNGQVYKYENHIGDVDNTFTYAVIAWINSEKDNPYKKGTEEYRIFNHLKILYGRWKDKQIDARLSYRRLSQYAEKLIKLIESKASAEVKESNDEKLSVASENSGSITAPEEVDEHLPIQESTEAFLSKKVLEEPVVMFGVLPKKGRKKHDRKRAD